MNICLLELRNQRRSNIISTLAICASIVAMLAFYPAMQTQAMQAIAGAKLEGLDPAVLAAFGLTDMMDFSLLPNFFGYVLQFVTLALMIVVTHRATALFIKEETDGTIEFLCAKPVSRSEIFLQKLAAHVLVLAASCAAFAAASVAGYLAFSDYTLRQSIEECARFYAGVLFAGLLFSAVGVLFSTLLTSSKGASGVTIALVMGSFIMGMVSAIVEDLHFLVWLSPLDWVKPQKMLAEGLTPGEWAAGLTIMALATLAAWLRYRRKDLLI